MHEGVVAELSHVFSRSRLCSSTSPGSWRKVIWKKSEPNATSCWRRPPKKDRTRETPWFKRPSLISQKPYVMWLSCVHSVFISIHFLQHIMFMSLLKVSVWFWSLWDFLMMEPMIIDVKPNKRNHLFANRQRCFRSCQIRKGGDYAKANRLYKNSTVKLSLKGIFQT